VQGLIIIPAYNEAANLPRVLARLRDAQLPEDVLVVNDGSRDSTEQVLRSLGQPHLRHPINLGYVRAIQSGIRYAMEHRYDYVLMMDADGQHDPATAPKLVEVLRGGQADLRVFSTVTALLGRQRVHDTTSGFKAIHRRAFQPLMEQAFGDFHAETLLLCMLLGLRVAEVPVHVAPRLHGESMYGPIDAIIYPLKTLVAILLVYLSHFSLRRRLKASLSESA
jgi:glycosyltransferase involved in cell wall biosynthesis